MPKNNAEIEIEELKQRLAKLDALNSQFRKKIDSLADENDGLKKEMLTSHDIAASAKMSVLAAREKAKNSKECSKRMKQKYEKLAKKLTDLKKNN